MKSSGQAPSSSMIVQLVVFFCYLIFGALVFQALEIENETRERQLLLNSRDDLQRRYNVSNEDLRRFVQLVQAIADQGFSDEWVNRWNFIGALFFSGTVVTTIGYGHLAPTTNGGRVFCIFYALIGIPLTWMLLARLGYMISSGVSSAISLFERQFLLREPSKVDLKSAMVTSLMALAMILFIAIVAHYTEKWSFFDGIYFGFVTLSTIGFGDLVPLHPCPGEDTAGYAVHVIVFTMLTLLYFTIGLAVVSSMMLSIRTAMEDPTLFGFHPVSSNEIGIIKDLE
ncbi:potassium channel subfamily K member 4-like [Xenia sp. Carnegie-2017]|uniref:potassium channel subfamily K member 4-like n=1 Tax=Xenia sp. Carnegie-2017 TaxID=2897299 RepID=UPI001F03429B|nr:potassium channel subfamily K member 4-like [Xenia sp. Carnegie-2017]